MDRRGYKEYRDNREPNEPYFPEGTRHENVYAEIEGRRFVWDKAKNEANIAAHGIDFYTAIYVFNDENRLEDDNSIVDGESRQQTLGEPRPPVLEGHPINTKRSRPKAVIGKVEGVLFVVFVENEDELGTSTRIISARAADEEEVAAYFEELMY